MSTTALKWLPVVLLVLGCHSPGAFAQAAPGAQTVAATELPLAELEKSYWVCDHATTTAVLDGGTAAICSSLYEALKQRKFGGDFEALLAWWRQHKEAEHLALAKAGGPSLAHLAPAAPK
ncbi:hypothetical protein [Piscinibacter sp.]|uniref:hypothetical protein n=1 Tax=Piscinibacter sp. TaxID=1903157 RepID=UPI002BF3962E|nr:hypothetical protein [Albitalea sp.]HUG22015.1 hypothetical protein [Albitalea sp.]